MCVFKVFKLVFLRYKSSTLLKSKLHQTTFTIQFFWTAFISPNKVIIACSPANFCSDLQQKFQGNIGKNLYVIPQNKS